MGMDSESNTSSLEEKELENIFAKEFIPWAQEQDKMGGLSFAIFVETCQFTDQNDAMSAYEMILSSSELRVDRRQLLQANYK
ncbi:hypothetical protein FBU30_006554, partial [Linnemannia zychae]